MIWWILVLLGLGVFLSAFFSGSETGFYRVSRIRLLLDGRDGDRVSRSLLWLTNNPALFVATTLVGNNLANYITSLGIVLAAQCLFSDAQLAELISPLALSPVIFVYCELLPKQLFFQAPNQLLRRGGPLLLVCTLLFSPVATLLWLLGRLIQSLLGQAPLRIRLTLARKELQRVLQEGQEAGILHPAQRELAQRLFANPSGNILPLCTPLARVTTVPQGCDKDRALWLARRQQIPVVPVRQADGDALVGYVRVIDLRLSPAATVEEVRPLARLFKGSSQIEALLQMQSQKADLACVVDQHDAPVGLLYAEHLTTPLFSDA